MHTIRYSLIKENDTPQAIFFSTQGNSQKNLLMIAGPTMIIMVFVLEMCCISRYLIADSTSFKSTIVLVLHFTHFSAFFLSSSYFYVPQTPTKTFEFGGKKSVRKQKINSNEKKNFLIDKSPAAVAKNNSFER